MGLSEFLDDSGIFFMLSCAIVYHCVALMAMIMITVTILTVRAEDISEGFMKDEERLAPKTVEC